MLLVVADLDIYDQKFPSNPLVFIGHCFGGLVVLKARM